VFRSVFGGFDPSGDVHGAYFQRRRWQSLLGAVLLVGGGFASAFYFASLEVDEPVELEVVEAELQNFDLEEQLEDEPEPAPEPPPPSAKPVERRAKPTPQPNIQNPDRADANPEPSDVNTDGPGYGEGGGGNDQGGEGDREGAAKPEPKPAPEQKPKPKPKADKFPYNPDKPIERPAEATVPKQIGGNSPVYPPDLKKRNITGKVKVRLTIYKDGTVKGAKVLAKDNSIDPATDAELHDKANALLLKAVAAAVQTWKFKPSMVAGKPISVFLTVTIPFTLS
jgi:periplasmic protein TonB